MTEKLVKGKRRKIQKIQHVYSRAEDMGCSKIVNSLSNEIKRDFCKKFYIRGRQAAKLSPKRFMEVFEHFDKKENVKESVAHKTRTEGTAHSWSA